MPGSTMHLRMEPTFDPADVAAFQMTGQDIPWLLRHWAEHKPDHPFLIWEPRAGGERTWTYRQFLDDASSLAAGLVGARASPRATRS